MTGAGMASLRPDAPVSLRMKDDSSKLADIPPPRSSLPRKPQRLVYRLPPSILLTALFCAFTPVAAPVNRPTDASTKPYSVRLELPVDWACVAIDTVASAARPRARAHGAPRSGERVVSVCGVARAGERR